MRRKLLIFVLILIFISLVIGWFITPVFNNYLYYSRLENQGLIAEGEILKKDEALRISFLRIFSSPVNYVIEIEFKDSDRKTHQIYLGVSKTFYDKHNVGDIIRIVCLKDNPEQCEVAESVKGTRYISRFVAVIGVVVWIALVLVPGTIGIFLIIRAESGKEIKLKISEMKCPECNSFMEEGYIPVTSGINWRRKNQSVGIITVFSGLPETVRWNPFNRPKLPGYHCPKCKVIFFKYRD